MEDERIRISYKAILSDEDSALNNNDARLQQDASIDAYWSCFSRFLEWADRVKLNPQTHYGEDFNCGTQKDETLKLYMGDGIMNLMVDYDITAPAHTLEELLTKLRKFFE